MNKIIISKTKCWIKKVKNPHGVIILIPGILTSIESSGFLSLLKIKSEFDIITYDVYAEANNYNLNKGIDDFVSDFKNIFNKLEKSYGYKNFYIISYSSGSEIVLRANISSEKIRAIALWSPSFFYHQNVTATLQPYQKKDNILDHEGTLISRKLAKEFDSFDTKKLISSIHLPIHIYSSIDEHGKKSWVNPEIFKLIQSTIKIHTSLPYRHIYTQKQIISLYYETCKWFNCFIM